MRFSTVAVAGFAVTAQAAVPKRGLKDLFKGEFTFPDGITISAEELVGPWDGPGDDETDVYHPSHEGVVIDHCDKTGEKEWHWVHEDKESEGKDDEYEWTTETITATETVIDCAPEVPCDGGKTVTVTIPETTTICPTPVEPPVVPSEKPEPPVESPPVEPPVHPTPSPEPPVEPPVEEPPITSEIPPPPPPPVPSDDHVPPPPEVTESVIPQPPPETVSEPVPPPPEETHELPTSSEIPPPPSQTSEGAEEGPTAAAVPNAQRAGGALVVAAIAAALL